MRWHRSADDRRRVLTVFFEVLVLCCLAETQSSFRRKFEYKLSFKGPHLVQRDGTIPFWDHFGSSIASEESVRITPSLRSKKGSVWSQMSNPHENWEVEVSFRVTGRGRVGADGLAVWYTQKRQEEGPVFGSADNWNGLGVFFDSFDNDGLHNNPYVSVMLNDGTKSYDHDTDGYHQQLGGCLKDFRNKPYLVRAKIEYYRKALTVSINNGLTNAREDFELCARAENVELPRNGYFGVSAATGALADDHDVFAFLTHSLVPSTDAPDVGTEQLPDDERQKFEKEFGEYQEKLDRAKEEYRKEHPDKRGEEYYTEDDKLFEQPEERELKMILDGQNEIYRAIKLLLVKLDEVVGRQERELSMLTMISQAQPHAPAADNQRQISGTGSIQRHEVDSLLNTQKDIVGTVRDVRSVVGDVQTRLKSSSVGAGSGEDHGSQQTQKYLVTIQNDIRTLLSKSKEVDCPPVESPVSCVTTTTLFILLAAQLACIIGYLIYRNSKDAAAKKFF